jgi:homeobox protein cut-like
MKPEYKKASVEDKIKAAPALLKGYQEEVDNLTKRAKFGENAFLNIYQKLYEAADPVPALTAGTVSSSPSSYGESLTVQFASVCKET